MYFHSLGCSRRLNVNSYENGPPTASLLATAADRRKLFSFIGGVPLAHENSSENSVVSGVQNALWTPGFHHWWCALSS
jgi:hypothetical protein